MIDSILTDVYSFYTEFYIPVDKKMTESNWFGDKCLLFSDNWQTQFSESDKEIVRVFGVDLKTLQRVELILNKEKKRVEYFFKNEYGQKISEREFTSGFHNNF